MEFISFRPLAGLSCINLHLKAYQNYCQELCFRPLAGLSCINLWDVSDGYAPSSLEFPSPRGVELHKPRVRQRHAHARDARVSVPSRG